MVKISFFEGQEEVLLNEMEDEIIERCKGVNIKDVFINDMRVFEFAIIAGYDKLFYFLMEEYPKTVLNYSDDFALTYLASVDDEDRLYRILKSAYTSHKAKVKAVNVALARKNEKSLRILVDNCMWYPNEGNNILVRSAEIGASKICELLLKDGFVVKTKEAFERAAFFDNFKTIEAMANAVKFDIKEELELALEIAEANNNNATVSIVKHILFMRKIKEERTQELLNMQKEFANNN